MCGKKWLFIKPEIQEWGIGNGMQGMQGTRKCSLGFQGMFGKIPGNVREDSGECSSRFRGMFGKIPGNVQKDCGESKFRFISGNRACFLSNFAVKLLRNNEK